MAMPSWVPEDSLPGSAVATPESPESPDSQPEDTAGHPHQDFSDEEILQSPESLEERVSVTDEVGVIFHRWKITWAPPDIVHQDRPSLQRVISHAWIGDWGPQTGPLRMLGRLDAIFFTVPWVTACYYAGWVGERPSRRWAAAVLLLSAFWWIGWSPW